MCENLKFGAIYCLYDDCEFLEVSLESIKSKVDKVIFLVSDIPWFGKAVNNFDTIQKIKKLCDCNPNFILIKNHWINEAEQRNFGLDYLFALHIDYCFVVDTDEIYHKHHIDLIKQFVCKNPKIAAFHIELNTYWTKQYYVISPRENFKPVIVVRVENFLFTTIRQGVTSIQRTEKCVFNTNQKIYNATIIPEVICYHLSYAKNDQQIKRKIETFSHANSIDKDWFDNTWKKWTPEDKNLHPVTPTQYRQAVKENFLNFPEQLKIFIKKERQNVQPCSIIIINWNSYTLLLECLKLIKQNTKILYEIVIVDNGSTDLPKDFSDILEFYSIKTIIYNKENLGFPKAVNQAIEVTNKNSDVCLLNVDAKPQEGWLENLYDTLNSNPLAGIVGPLGNEIENGYQKENMVYKDMQVFNVHFYCALIFREVIERIGLLDIRFGLGTYEDNDYCIRAKLGGYQCWISAKSLVRHKAHQVFESNNIDYIELEHKNKQLLQNKLLDAFYQYGSYLDFISISPKLARKCGLVFRE